jgi:hypothetical protein
MPLIELILGRIHSAPLTEHLQPDYLSLFFKTYDTPPARKWLKLLITATSRGLGVEQYFLKTHKVSGRFVGFPAHQKNAHDLAHLINQCIHTINTYQSGAIPMQASETTQQSELNQLHKYFEDHRGTVLQPGAMYVKGPDEVKVALEDYNLLIHEYESFIASTHSGVDSQASLDVTFVKNWKREPLAPEDYAYFDPARDFGGIYLHYCEVGKQVLDAYFNKDEVVGGDNVRPLQYASANFDIFFGRPTQSVFELEFKKDFNAWLIKQGLDPRDPKLSVGYLKVGELIIDNRLKFLSRADFLSFISGHLDVRLVKVHD